VATAKRSVGRPRDTSIDERVLDVTRSLLAHQGFDQTTIQAISERSGIHPSAIYRRWPSRIEIIEQVVFPGLNSVKVKPTGDLRADLHRFIRAYASTLDAPAARAAIPGLLAAYQSSERPRTSQSDWVAVSARPQFVDIVAAAPRGSIDPHVDIDDVFDTLLGSVMARILVPTVAGRDRPVERLVVMTERLLMPLPEKPS
jgi:AcrR family transcriptional regulator